MVLEGLSHGAENQEYVAEKTRRGQAMKRLLPLPTEKKIRVDSIRVGFNAAMIVAMLVILYEHGWTFTRWMLDGLITIWGFFQ